MLTNDKRLRAIIPLRVHEFGYLRSMRAPRSPCGTTSTGCHVFFRPFFFSACNVLSNVRKRTTIQVRRERSGCDMCSPSRGCADRPAGSVYFRFPPRHVVFSLHNRTQHAMVAAGRACATPTAHVCTDTPAPGPISLNPERGSNLNPEVSSRGGMATVQVGLKPRGAHSQPECKPNGRTGCPVGTRKVSPCARISRSAPSDLRKGMSELSRTCGMGCVRWRERHRGEGEGGGEGNGDGNGGDECVEGGAIICCSSRTVKR